MRYEEESFRIQQAMLGHEEVRVNEMGGLSDLLEAVGTRDRPVDVVHYSGNGSPRKLHFEDEFGYDDPVDIEDLIKRMRQRAPDRQPTLFYLASCHGQTQARVEG